MDGVFVMPDYVEIEHHGRERGAGDGIVPPGGGISAVGGLACGLDRNSSPDMGFVPDVAPPALEQGEDGGEPVQGCVKVADDDSREWRVELEFFDACVQQGVSSRRRKVAISSIRPPVWVDDVAGAAPIDVAKGYASATG